MVSLVPKSAECGEHMSTVDFYINHLRCNMIVTLKPTNVFKYTFGTATGARTDTPLRGSSHYICNTSIWNMFSTCTRRGERDSLYNYRLHMVTIWETQRSHIKAIHRALWC